MGFILFLLLALAVAGAVGATLVHRVRTRQSMDRIVAHVRTAAKAPSTPPYRSRAAGELPPPVRRYLQYVLPNSQAPIQSVRLEQKGQFRDADADASWHPFTATQHVTSSPLAFVWDASIRMIPGISVRVIDAYHDGRGHLQGVLGGILTVLKPPASPTLDEGELMRYLAEAPLYPTVLLPGGNVSWSPLNDHSAQATLDAHGTTASLVFHFNDRNEIQRVTGTRGFLTDDGTYELRPWRGYWRKYETRNGIRVPTEGEVAWIQPDGEVSYWQGTITDIDHQFSAPSADPRSAYMPWRRASSRPTP